MCCSVSPGVPVRFSGTVLYAAEVSGEDGKPAHVLGYQNTVQIRAEPRRGLLDLLFGTRGNGGNAMILPFPAVPGTMTAANVLDTSKCRHVLEDIARAVNPPPPSRSLSLSRSFSSGAPPVQVFEAAGIYTVVLARNPRHISAALNQVPRAKRSVLNPDLFDAYARWYPDWTIALCCFNNRQAQRADPLLWWYEPMFPDSLFLPGLDCHTGDVPNLDASVDVDHVVAVGSTRGNNGRSRPISGRSVHYSDPLPSAVGRYLCRFVLGQRYNERMSNGDFVFQLQDVRDGAFKLARSKPLAA